MTHIFISYSRVDNKITKELAGLINQSFDDVWYDTSKLIGGDDWWAEILVQIEKSDHFIFLLSPESVDSEWCIKELNYALDHKKHIIPVMIRERTKIPDLLKPIHTIESYSEITVLGLNAIYASIIRSAKQTVSKSNSEKEQGADLKLLTKLWNLIHTDLIIWLNDSTQYGYIDKDQFYSTFTEYYYQRRKPENHFFNESIETVFALFDDGLDKYRTKMVEGFTTGLDQENKKYLISHMKSETFRNDKAYSYQSNLYDTIVDLVLDLKQTHFKLVQVTKTEIPEFEFTLGNS